MNICWIWKCNHINKRCLQHDTSIHLGGETETRTCRQNTCSSIRLAIASLLKHPKRSLESTNLCVNSFLPLTSYLSLNWLYIYCSTALVTEKRSYFSSNCLALLQRLIPILCDTKIYKIIIIRQQRVWWVFCYKWVFAWMQNGGWHYTNHCVSIYN